MRVFGNDFWCFHVIAAVHKGDAAIVIRKHDSITVAHCESADDGRFCIADALVWRELARFVRVYAANKKATRTELYIRFGLLTSFPGEFSSGRFQLCDERE